MMRAPDNFQPQLVNTTSMPYAAAPAWLRSQRYPGEQTFLQADQHAMQVAEMQHDSFKDLLFHLVYTERWSDVEAARVLFRWMTCKHMYSIEFAGAPPSSPEELLMSFRDNKTTYCRIYELLCLYAGIPCITVVGYAKGIEVRPGSSLQDQKFNHSWNVIFVDDAWQLVDCHWATRYLQSNDCNVPKNMVYEYDDFYFCPDPEALVYSHFPEDPKWQLLRQPLSMYDFEDLPVTKSAFFKNDLRFLSHHSGVIATQNGCASISLGNFNPLSFTFKLLYGESCKDELGGVKLTRYGIQETRDGQVNLFVRAPVKGFYYLTVYSTQIKRRFQDENVYNAVCEYKIICETPYPNAEPYPFVSDTNWGPGADVYQAGLIPNNRNAVIVAPDGHIELDFEKVKPMRVLPKLMSVYANEKQCEQAIKQDDNEFVSRVDIDLPVNGEYALEIYANDPARDGNTYTHVCQYLLVKPNKGDATAGAPYNAPEYRECYNVHGMKEPFNRPNMSLEQLARGMGDVRLTDTMSAEPRPSAKQAAMTGVEIEQVTVPSKNKPGVAPKPKDKPTVPSKPAPKPKPKPGVAGAGRVGDGPQHAGEEYADRQGSGSQGQMPGAYPGEEYAAAPGSAAYGNRPPHDAYQQPFEYLDQQAQSAAGSHQGVPPTKFSELGYGAQPYKGAPGRDGYGGGESDAPGAYTSEMNVPGYGQKGDPRFVAELSVPVYGQPGDTRYGQPQYGQEGDPRYGQGVDPRYGQEGDPRYAQGGDPRYGQDAEPQYAQLGDPRFAKKGEARYGRSGDLGYPGMGGEAYAGKEGYDEFGRPLAGYGQSQDDMERHGRQRSGADDDLLGSGQYGGRGPGGRNYSQSGMSDEDFPAPPPASDMLNMEFAPERNRSEVPIAPTSFEPIHIAEVDTQLSNVPKPVPPQLEENLVFSAERAQQFKTVDTHAVQVAKTEHNSFRDLIWDLIYDKNITDDLEKARVIFLWLCTKDLGSMQFRNVMPGSPEEILLNVKQGKASYAQIYETLCSYAGLHCRVIRGYAKGADYKPGMRFRGTQAFHAWNAVLIHGHWRLIDCHWASRRMFGKKGTEHIRYELDDYYFCVDPRQLIYTHFPEDKQWQLLEQPYELDEFEDLPLVKSLFFRYCLQLESHTYSTIVVDDEFQVMVNYQYYRGPGLEFTFSLHTDEGEEAVSGVPLSRFGVQGTTSDGKVNFRIRPPAVGVYKLAVYAKEVQVGEKQNRMYCAVVEYRLEVGGVPPHIVPYPPCSGTSWGISPATAKKNGLSTKFTSGVLYTKNGQSEVRFKLHRQLLFSGKLRSNVYSEDELKSCILYRTVGETAIFSVSVPAPGEYGLEVFVNDPTVDGKSLRHMCQYLLICDEPQVSGIRFPQLPPAYLGPQQAYTRLGMNTISNKDPLIHCTEGSIEVSFSTSIPLRATSNLILTAGGQDLTEYILQQFRDNTLIFQIRLPRAGIYKFQIFAQPIDDTSDSLPGVYNYLINCSNVPVPPLPFPKQFSQWKEGCYLLTPVDGDLAASQPSHDPRPDYIFFQVCVPNASRVAVVVGTEWTHLECNQEGVWEGAAFFQAGWGQEDTAALTANYGPNSASYNTLLEFRM